VGPHVEAERDLERLANDNASPEQLPSLAWISPPVPVLTAEWIALVA